MGAITCIALGLWFLVSALANWDWYKGIDIAAAESLGESATRWLCGIVGVVVIGLGIAWLVQAC
jgi:hypothetical protein